MNYREKHEQLRENLKQRIIPSITGDYVLYGLPYYDNIGDTLIWNGTLDLLKECGHKCLETCGWDDYPKTKLEEDVTILISGGGYFGDVWRKAWQNVLDGIEPNKSNNIIILPCSIFYEDEVLSKKDAEYLAKFENLKIFVRDEASLKIAKTYFKNQCELVPDMAFGMRKKTLQRWSRRKPMHKNLLFQRNDKERTTLPNGIPTDCEIHDWEAMERPMRGDRYLMRLYGWCHRLSFINASLPDKTRTWLLKTIRRKMLTASGVRQLSRYETIYSTRLHATILGMLLGRTVYFIDNSYGKIGSYYRTWLSDVDTVSPLTEEK